MMWVNMLRVSIALPFVFIGWIAYEVADVIGGEPLERFIKEFLDE